MAENIPSSPAGAVPPKKETGKVQPKKETVRINLPPKPTAAPTIKLPTLPPGGPTGASAAPAAAAAPTAAAPAPTAPRAAAAPMAMASKPGPASTAAPAPRAAAPAKAPSMISGIDVGLAVFAMIAGLAAVGTTLYLIYGISIDMPTP